MAARRLCRQRRTCARSCRPQRQLPPSPQPSRRQLLTYVPSCRCRRPSRQRRDPSRPHRQNRRPRRPRTRRPRWMRWRRRWLPPRTLASRWMTSEKRSCPAMCSAHLSHTIHTTSSQDAPITAGQQFRSLPPLRASAGERTERVPPATAWDACCWVSSSTLSFRSPDSMPTVSFRGPDSMPHHLLVGIRRCAQVKLRAVGAQRCAQVKLRAIV